MRSQYPLSRLRSFAAGILLTVLSVGSLVASEFQQDLRTWKDATGRFEIEASFVRVDGKDVVLEKSDGTRISVALAKLSGVDQGFVEGLVAATKDANPFREMNESATETPEESVNSEPSAGGSITVDFEACPETTIATGNWDVSIPEQPAPGFDLSPVTLPGPRDFFEKLVHTAVNPVAGRLVLTYHLDKPGRRDEPSTRLTMVDLEKGAVVANAIRNDLWHAMAIHDDGQHIVIRNQADSDEARGQLATVRLNDDKMVTKDVWTPYAKMKEAAKEKVVTFARFINDGRLLTLSQNGRAVIWDFQSRKPIRQFRYHGACQPSLTHDRSRLAICGGDVVGIVNLDDDSEKPSARVAPQMNYWLSSAFSPSCKRFAAATMSKLMVWDIESGDVLFEGNIPGLSTAGKILFPHEDFVMINNDKLIEFATGIKVWRYHGATAINVDGQTVFAAMGKSQGKILPLQIPHKEAVTWLVRAKEDSDLFVLKKGVGVSIDVSDVPSKYRGDVEQSLKQNLDRLGFEYAENADVVLKAKIEGPSNEAVQYHFAGNFVIRQYNSFLNIVYDGKSIWSSRGSNVPGAVSGGSVDEIKKELDKAGRAPNIKFFGSARLPDFLQKPTQNGSSSDPQMLGATRIGVNGFEK